MPKKDYHLSENLSLHGENSSLRRGSLGAKLYWPGNETKGAHYAWGPGEPQGEYPLTAACSNPLNKYHPPWTAE